MNETILITGPTGGIGLEMARTAASHGYNLVLVARSAEKLEPVTAELQEKVEVTEVIADLSDPIAPETIFSKLQKDGVAVHHLINNAGFGDFGRFDQTDWRREQQMIQVNITALTQLTKLFLPAMVDRGAGRILNLASTAAFQPGPLMAVYYATKAYVLSFSEAIAYELRDTGVTVTALCPGPTRSGFQSASHIEDSKLVKNKKLPTADEVAEYGFEAMMAGRPVAVHGFMNQVMAVLVGFLPRSWVVQTVARMQEKG